MSFNPIDWRIRVIHIPDPGLGLDVSQQVPDGVLWRLLSFTAQLKTSAVVNTRQPSLRLLDGPLMPPFAVMPSNGGGLAANSTQIYSFQVGVAPLGLGVLQLSALGDQLILTAPYLITTQTPLLDVGDNWTNAVILVREFQLETGPRAPQRYINPGAMVGPGAASSGAF